VGRPGWTTALQAPGFVVLAATTGTAAAIIVAALLRNEMGERARLDDRIFRWLSNTLLILTIVYAYFVVVELIAYGYTGNEYETRVTEEIITGSYAWMFWLSASLVVLTALICAIQLLTGKYAIRYIVTAAILLNIGAFFKRYLIVVPSLTVGTLLPYSKGSYMPTWVEYLVVLGMLALGVLFFMIFMKVFPILSHSDSGEGSDGGEA